MIEPIKNVTIPTTIKKDVKNNESKVNTPKLPTQPSKDEFIKCTPLKPKEALKTVLKEDDKKEKRD